MDKEDVAHMHSRILLSRERVEIMASAETWTDLQGIMLNEIFQTEKDKYCMNHLYVESIF